MNEWQSTETAPKDRHFLAWVDGRARVVRWGKTSHVPVYGFCLADQGAEDFDPCKFEHWTDFPPAPPPAPAQQAEPKGWLVSDSEGNDEYIDNPTALSGRHHHGDKPTPLYTHPPADRKAQQAESVMDHGLAATRVVDHETVDMSHKAEQQAEDSRMLDWIVAQGDQFSCAPVTEDGPGDGEHLVYGVTTHGRGKSAREAIRAAMEKEKSHD